MIKQLGTKQLASLTALIGYYITVIIIVAVILDSWTVTAETVANSVTVFQGFLLYSV